MILGVFMLGIYLIGKWGEPLRIDGKCRFWILIGAALEFICVWKLTAGGTLTQRFLWAVMGGSLLLACVTDSLLRQIYNFTWWIALAAAAPLLWQYCWKSQGKDEAALRTFSALVLFFLLQFLLFQRTYGRADCYAFCVCAVAEASQGLSMADFLRHMLYAYLLLMAVQLLRRNINKRGNLKRPVPFLPYITVSFWIAVLWGTPAL